MCCIINPASSALDMMRSHPSSCSSSTSEFGPKSSLCDTKLFRVPRPFLYCSRSPFLRRYVYRARMHPSMSAVRCKLHQSSPWPIVCGRSSSAMHVLACHGFWASWTHAYLLHQELALARRRSLSGMHVLACNGFWAFTAPAYHPAPGACTRAHRFRPRVHRQPPSACSSYA